MRLQAKVLSASSFLALIAAGSVLFLSKEAINTILIQGVADRGFLETAEMTPKMSPGMGKMDEKILLPLLHDAAARTHASYAMVLDSRGTVIAHTNVIEKGKIYSDPFTRYALSLKKPGFQLIDLDDAKILDAAVPIWANDDDFLLSHEKEGRTRLGTLRLGLPLEQALEIRAKILRRIASILFIAFGVKVLMFLLFLRKAIGPVRMLADSAGKIGRGQYGIVVPVPSKDEIGDLAHSFNKMSEALATTTVSRDYLNGVMQSIVDILIVADSKGNIRTINDAASKTLGYSETELLGLQAACIFETKKAAATAEEGEKPLRFFKESDREALARIGSVKDIELNLLTKTHEKVPVLLSGSVLKTREGSPDGIVLIAKDITERKRLEMMLAQSEKLSAVGQLAAGVAHEINNPLGVILGFAQSAIKRIQASDALSLPIKSIEREAMRCKNLVQNLLAFSRQGKAKMEEFDLNETVTSTLSIIEAQARVKAVEIFKELGAVPTLLGDKNQIQQVIVNLCSNAIDAMPNGGKIVIRTSHPGRDGNDGVILDVEDNGSGIPEGIRDKIFNPFFTTKEVGKGTGLGLSLVYEIIQKHKGTIELRSEVGRGTTFSVFLPLK